MAWQSIGPTTQFNSQAMILASGTTLTCQGQHRAVSMKTLSCLTAAFVLLGTAAGHCNSQPKDNGSGPRAPVLAAVHCVAISPDGTRGVTSYGDKLTLWSLPDGKAIRDFEPMPGKALTGGIYAREYEYDRTVEQVAVRWKEEICVGGDGKGILRVWDLGNGKLLRSIEANKYKRTHGHGISAIALSRDGHRIYSSGYENEDRGSIKVWDLQSGKQQATLAEAMGDPASYGYLQILLLDDGRRMLLRSTYDLWLWDAVKDQQLWTRKFFQPVMAAATEDGKTLLVYSPPRLFLARVNGEELGNLMSADPGAVRLAHRPTVLTFVPPDGKRVLTGGMDGDLVLWDVATRKFLGTWQSHHYEAIRVISLSADGTLALVGHDKGVISLSDVSARKQLRTMTVGR
jgi:WD40 repeat protein